MISDKFIILGALLSLYGGASYVVSTLKGETKPNRVSWLLWAIIPAIALSAQLSEGVRWQAVMTFIVGFNPLLIFIASFVNKKAYWQISRLDIACGLISALAIVLWKSYGTGNIAIILSIVADFLAGLPTMIKAYGHPETENYKIFLFGAVNATITLLTVRHFTIASAAFAIYILAVCLVLVWLIKGRPNGRIAL